MDLETVVNQARLLDHARKSIEFYSTKQLPFGNTTAAATAGADTRSPDLCAAATDNQKQLCFFCGNSRHPRANCPARDRNCHKCGRRGHFGTVCKSKLPVKTTASTLPDEKPTSSASAWISVTSSTCAMVKSMTSVTINGITAKALVDSGSTDSFICRRLADRMQLKVIRAVGSVKMASSTLVASIEGYCCVDIRCNGNMYKDVRLSVLSDLCADVILGEDFLGLHREVKIRFDGRRPPLKVCCLAEALVSAPTLFAGVPEHCKPIATSSRRFTISDKQFISREIKRLLDDGIIEQSCSPWRAQVVIATPENHKRRLVVDYSQINLLHLTRIRYRK